MNTIRLTTDYYQQFDADHGRDVSGEGYGGWQKGEVEVSLEHTALVVMHAWHCGKPDEYPGWKRAVEYEPRARRILAEIFPALLSATRASPLPVFHVVGGRDYYSHLPGYRTAADAAETLPAPSRVAVDPVYERLEAFRAEHIFPGAHNRADAAAGFSHLDFASEARPGPREGIAANGAQLAALCRSRGINHLIYVGFAINWCLLMSPGGMVDMRRYGFICSTLREAVTAVENRETAREEREKTQALWRVSLEFGFVFSVPDFILALSVPAEREPAHAPR